MCDLCVKRLMHRGTSCITSKKQKRDISRFYKESVETTCEEARKKTHHAWKEGRDMRCQAGEETGGALNPPNNRQIFHCPAHVTTINTGYKMTLNQIVV